MMIEAVRPEIISSLLPLGVFALALAYSAKQKLWIHRRDKNTCQLPNFQGITCDPKHLEIDHVIPQRYAREVLNMPDNEIDSPVNGILLCKNHHRGHPKSKHPDAHVALWIYGQNKDSFKELFKVRDMQCEEAEEYWNGTYDTAESAIALRNTLRYEREHPKDKYPTKADKASSR